MATSSFSLGLSVELKGIAGIALYDTKPKPNPIPTCAGVKE